MHNRIHNTAPRSVQDRKLRDIMRSGYITRWHSNPDLSHIRENLAEHHCRVAQILLALHPDPTVTLIDAALHHDCGEILTGDVPGPFKAAHPVTAEVLRCANFSAAQDLGISPAITPEDRAWIKFADMLSAWLHVEHVRPELLLLLEWLDHISQTVAMGRELGVTL